MKRFGKDPEKSLFNIALGMIIVGWIIGLALIGVCIWVVFLLLAHFEVI